MLKSVTAILAMLASSALMAQTAAIPAGETPPAVMAAQSPDASAAAQPSDMPCPAPLNDRALMKFFTDMLLTPGATFSIKGIPAEEARKAMAYQKESADRKTHDWANICQYASENADVIASGQRPQAVLMGDSITAYWIMADPSLFSAKMLDRGIGGQTTSQMLLRMYPDVIALRPRVVHILAGVNDIFGNTGPVSDQIIVANIRAMIDIAQANGIKVVLGAMTPSTGFALRANFNPSQRIVRVNALLRRLAAEMHIAFVDYYTVVADNPNGGFRNGLANDGLHPNRDGYKLMRPLLEAAIGKAAKGR